MSKSQANIMTLDELATYLKLSKSSLYKLCQAGKVPGAKVGKHWRFHRDKIDAWIKEGVPPTQPYGRDGSQSSPARDGHRRTR